MTKNIMSIAAIAAIFGTSAFAFDTDTTGAILDRNGNPAAYTNGIPAADVLTRSVNDATGDRLKGDALIFPAFDMSNDWQTEIVVRNNLNDTAVIGKVVVYAADDSRELVDFNIYLSQNDQFRMNMADGKITSTDGSVAILERFSETDDRVTFASEAAPFELDVVDPLSKQVVSKGYVIVYGMGQTTSYIGTGTGATATKGYHTNHTDLFAHYRYALKTTRAGWSTQNMSLGVYTETIVAPNVTGDATDFNLTEVNSTALSGTSRIYNAEGEKRDILINPTALANFTSESDDQLVLWAPGEYATLADRQINSGAYRRGGVNGDNDTFVVKSVTYTFNNTRGDVDNQILFTQPMKRLLVQLGYGADYWVHTPGTGCADIAGLPAGQEWGFRADITLYNEDELQPGQITPDDPGEPITSPRSSGSTTVNPANCQELHVLAGLEKDDNGDVRQGFEDGFIDFNLTTGTREGIPAIVTQMSATRVGGDARINWIYSPATK